MTNTPQIPVLFDLFGWVIVAVLVAVALWAVVDIVRSTRQSLTARALWIIVVLLLPILGSLVWFATAKPRRPA